MDYKTFKMISMDYCEQVSYDPKNICDRDNFHKYMFKQMSGYPNTPDGVKKKLKDLSEYEARFNNEYQKS